MKVLAILLEAAKALLHLHNLIDGRSMQRCAACRALASVE